MSSIKKLLAEKAFTVFLGSLAIGLLVRTYQYAVIPPGLHQDEASLMYDAYSLLHFGIERNGFAFPVMLVAYGSSQSGTLAAYLMMPILAIFDLSIASGRMLNWLLGVGSLFVFYGLAKKVTTARVGLFALFLLAINPWHIMISRWGFDCNVFPAVFLLGIYLLCCSAEHKKYLPYAFGVLALSLYSYGTALLVVPIFLACTLIYTLYHKVWPLKSLLLALGVFAVIALPMGSYLLINQLELPSLTTKYFSIPNMPTKPTYQANATILQSNAITSAYPNLKRFLALMYSQDDGLITNRIPGYGFMYSFTFPLVFYGLFVTRRKIRQATSFHPASLLIFWLIAASSLALALNANINRINIIFLPLIFFAAVGLAACKNWLQIGLVLVYIASFVSFSHHYFTRYPSQVGSYLFYSLDQAIRRADQLSAGGPICVTDRARAPEVAVLFHLKIDPSKFYKTVVYANPNAKYRHSRSFDRFTFGLNHCLADQAAAFVVRNDEIDAFDSSLHTIHQYKYFSAVAPKGG